MLNIFTHSSHPEPVEGGGIMLPMIPFFVEICVSPNTLGGILQLADIWVVCGIKWTGGHLHGCRQSGKQSAEMKCSKCGREIKNLPEYIEETDAEVLCSVCAGTADRDDNAILLFDRLRYRRAAYTVQDNDMDIAA